MRATQARLAGGRSHGRLPAVWERRSCSLPGRIPLRCRVSCGKQWFPAAARSGKPHAVEVFAAQARLTWSCMRSTWLLLPMATGCTKKDPCGRPLSRLRWASCKGATGRVQGGIIGRLGRMTPQGEGGGCHRAYCRACAVQTCGSCSSNQGMLRCASMAVSRFRSQARCSSVVQHPS
jgi:hypothetical protein